MSERTCPVSDLITRIGDAIDSGKLAEPRSRRRAEDILALLQDVAWGRAAAGHLPAIESLAQKIADQGKTDASRRIGEMVRNDLDKHREVFTSHIETHQSFRARRANHSRTKSTVPSLHNRCYAFKRNF